LKGIGLAQIAINGELTSYRAAHVDAECAIFNELCARDKADAGKWCQCTEAFEREVTIGCYCHVRILKRIRNCWLGSDVQILTLWHSFWNHKKKSDCLIDSQGSLHPFLDFEGDLVPPTIDNADCQDQNKKRLQVHVFINKSKTQLSFILAKDISWSLDTRILQSYSFVFQVR